MIIEASVPVLTTARAAGDKKRKLWLTRVPVSFDFKERYPDTFPVIAEWREEHGQQQVIRRSAERGPFLALSSPVPTGHQKFETELWGHAYDCVSECLTGQGEYSEDDILYAYVDFLMEPFDELVHPDLAMIEQQVELHRKDLSRYVVVDGAIYEPCDQPYLALLESENKFSVEPRFEHLGKDHEPVAKFSMADGENINRWLAANLPAFKGGADIAAYHCHRPDMFDDRNVEYASYSLVHRFASGVGELIYSSDPIKLTRFLATINEREASLCIDAEIVRDPQRGDASLVNVEKTAREILAIAQTSALWPAFGQAVLLSGLHKLAAQVLGVLPAGPSERIEFGR